MAASGSGASGRAPVATSVLAGNTVPSGILTGAGHTATLATSFVCARKKRCRPVSRLTSAPAAAE